MTTTTNLGITLVEASQAQKEVTINDGFICLDALMGNAVLDKDLATPPASPADGDVYIIAAGGTDAWSGHDNNITYFSQIWRFIVPTTGMRVWLRDESQYYTFDGSSWIAESSSDLSTGNLLLADQGVIISSELVTDYSSYVWPMIWLTTDDSDPHAGGPENPFCSITLENRSAGNKFGELAFQSRVSGVPTDTWSFAVDPGRANTENFKLRHTGADIMEFAADNSQVRLYTNFVLDGSIGKILQSYNAAGTDVVNLIRMAAGDRMIYGMTTTALTGMQFEAGTAGIAMEIDGASAVVNLNPSDNGRTLVGGVTDDGSTQLQVHGNAKATSFQVDSGSASTFKHTGTGTGFGSNLPLSLWSEASGRSVMIQFYDTANDAYIGLVGGDRFALGCSTEMMAIKRSSGNVIINTTSDDGQNKLQVNGSVGVNVATPNASAALEVQSITQGALFPRMTTTQKNAIASPAEGLVVYDTTLHKLCVRTASAWETITSV